MKYIEHLRAKPLHHRKRIAVGVSAGITVIIALFWYSSFSYFNTDSLQNVQVATINSENSPFQVFKQGVANVYEGITGSKVHFDRDQQASSTATLEYVPN